MERATFGAGCFWGVEAAFHQLKGVVSTAVGYAGGRLANPTYQEVCTGETGHAEVVELEFDPAEITYRELLDVFWAIHDPTQVNRQGPDVGEQYRSVVFCHSPEQEAAAMASKAKIERLKHFKKPIMSEIRPSATFYRAEEFHQRYLEKHGMAACHIR